ncbi:MAG: dockerin type I repeat-containing protein [bacterium]
MKARVLLLLMFACLLMVWSVAEAQQDPNDPNEADSVIIRPYAVLLNAPPWPDSIGVPIEIWADETLAGYSLGFTVTGPGAEYFTVSSVDQDGPCLAAFNSPVLIRGGDTNSVLFGWQDFTGVNPCPSPQGHLATIYLLVDPTAPAGTIANLDSVFVRPAGNFIFVSVEASDVNELIPQFENGSESGLPNIVLGESTCGDVDGSGILDISDAVTLIGYIFGLSGQPDGGNMDVNCDGKISISDVVYLIWYIFATGSAPCDPNNDGLPDC